MQHEIIKLREKETNGFIPTLTTYVLDDPLENNRRFPAVLICPGGGYSFCSPRETEPIALQFSANAVHTFVLNYSVAPMKFPTALEDVSTAMSVIRKNADRWNVDPDKIAVCGFSAGGHLAASLGVFWNSEPIKTADGSNKPNALILGYPVITSGEFAHDGSFDNLCGDDEALREHMSLEFQVTKDTPPTFLWHTFTDSCVPLENSLLFAGALRRKGIPFELHVYPKGPHGLATASDYTCTENNYSKKVPEWFDLANAFIKEIFEQ